MRLGLLEQIEKKLKDHGITEWQAKDLQTKQDWTKFSAWLKNHIAKHPADAVLSTDLTKYGKVAVAYDFDFNITEDDNIDSSLAFKLPLAKSTFDLSAGGSLHATRAADRAFKAQETFAELVTRDIWCAGFQPRDKNLVYPITGSIGLRKVVETFVAISEQGGGKDSFVDTLTFTTTISGSLGPKISINPVPKSFRLVSANATIGADRTDKHKITISLAFPQDTPTPSAVKKIQQQRLAQTGQAVSSGFAGSTEGYPLNTVWRARYNICVADARSREETFNALRLTAPEVYCISYADAFVPRYTDPRLQQQLLLR